MKDLAFAIAKGEPISKRLEKNKVLHQYYETYDMCRSKSFVTFRKPSGRKPGEEKIVTAIFPNGYAILPREGGLEDQDFITMKLFHAAFRGEMEAFYRVIADKQHV
jgi:hypothetical protein